MPVLTRVPQGKPRVPPNPVFSSDLTHLFFVTAKYDVFFLIKKNRQPPRVSHTRSMLSRSRNRGFTLACRLFFVAVSNAITFFFHVNYDFFSCTSRTNNFGNSAANEALSNTLKYHYRLPMLATGDIYFVAGLVFSRRERQRGGCDSCYARP